MVLPLNIREEDVRGSGRGRLTNAWIVGIFTGEEQKGVESDRQLGWNQKAIKWSCNRAAKPRAIRDAIKGRHSLIKILLT